MKVKILTINTKNNSSWKSWIAGEFEVEGVDRTQLAKELETRGIDYSKIDDWSASASQKEV